MKKLLLCALLCLFYTSAHAEELVSFYEIKDVPIAESGGNATDMRDKAITEGQRNAMDILQGRLMSKGYIGSKRNITEDQINSAIDSIEVRDEKIFTKSYRASLNVTFSARVISQLFNIEYIKPSPAPEKFLVIPILNDADGTKLWRHKWWDVMQKLKNKNIILPLGDLEDVRNFTKEDYAVRDFRNLVKLQKKYNTTAILLAVAEYIPGEHSINLGLEKIKGTEVNTYNYELSGNDNDAEPQLFALAANELVKKVNRNNFEESFSPAEEDPVLEEDISKDHPAITDPGYQRDTPRTDSTTSPKIVEDTPAPIQEEPEPAIDPSENQLTDVYVIAEDLMSWGRIRGKITSTDLVKNIRIKSFTAGRAYVTLQHEGDFTGVISRLEENGLTVRQGTKYWEIRERK